MASPSDDCELRLSVTQTVEQLGGRDNSVSFVAPDGSVRLKGLDRLRKLGYSDEEIENYRQRLVDRRKAENVADGKTTEERKQELGEKLFLMLEQSNPKYAQIVTGLILERSEDVIAYLLRKPKALEQEVAELIKEVEENLSRENSAYGTEV